MQGFPFDSQLTFDSDNLPVYDRAVSSQPLRKLIRDLFTTGVMPNPSTNLQVSSGTDGMTVQVQAGFAVVDGGLCQETETRTLEVTAADTTYDRIDTVVLRWNENVDVRTADLYVVAGTPSATPVRPTLQRDNSIYEIGLADVFVTRNVATITDEKITDTRYEDERCGIVSSVSEWDTTTIYQQVQADLAGFKSTEQAEFMAWFDTIKDILDSETAGHLQGEIDQINETLGNLDASTISFDDTTAQTGSTNVQGAIDYLKSSFSSALTSLKNTAIAQAVGATGDTFTSVIAKLAEIVNRSAWSANMSSTGSVTIPIGYHNGTGTVKTSGTATITTNGTHNIAQYTNANVNVPKNPYHSRFVYGINSLNMTRVANRCYYIIVGGTSNQLAVGYININGAFTWLRDIGSGTSAVLSVTVGPVGDNINVNNKGYNSCMTIIEVLAS